MKSAAASRLADRGALEVLPLLAALRHPRFSKVHALHLGEKALFGATGGAALARACPCLREIHLPQVTTCGAQLAQMAVHFPRLTTLSVGVSCRDGADLLEGPLDDYTDCDEVTRLCTLTTKCRDRCARRPVCTHFTTYSSGFCQLSSRCADEVTASETGARTFRRRTVAGASS